MRDPPPPPCNVPSLSLACSSLPFPALALAPCSFPGTKAGPIAAFPIFSPSKVCRNARQADHRRRHGQRQTSAGRPEHASRSMTHDPHLCSPPQTHQGSLHSTPLQVLSASNTHTHTICINLLHLAIFNTTSAPATSHPPAVSEVSIQRQRRPPTDCCSRAAISSISSIPTNALRQAFSITQVLLLPPMRPNL